MKKTICLIAALCMLLTLFPMTAVAEAATQPHSGKGSIPVQVNPLYADILDAEEISRTHTSRPVYTTDGDEEYVEESQLPAVIRENLKQRNGEFTVYLKTSNDDLAAAITDAFNDAFDHTGVPTEGDYLAWHYGWWSVPNYDYYYDQGAYYVEILFNLAYYTTAAQEAELDLAVDALLSELNLYGKSDYEKLCGVYDYITENIYYDYENLNNSTYELQYTAYAALVHKTAVCQGYANLLYRLLLELGVENRMVVGDAGGPHAWNIVELEDWYYYADSTWDATNAQSGWDYEYFLRGSNVFTQDHTPDPKNSPCVLTCPISATDYVPGQPGQEPEPESWPKTGYCGDNVTWSLTEDGLLTLSGTGSMWDYEYVDPEWYPYAKYIQECVIEEGVTDLGDYAFYKCYNLSSIDLPNSLQYMGEGAFTYCGSLTDVTIPDGITSIGRQTFADCTALTSVTIPASVVSIGEIAFLYCDMLQDVYYGGSQSQWAQIDIQDDNGCLLNATIHYGQTDPNPEPEPDPEPETWPKTGYCGDNVTWSLTEDGLLTISGTGTTWDYPEEYPGWYDYLERVNQCVISEGITTIGAYLFYDCWYLTSVQVPDSVHYIGEGAFAYCDSLTTVNIPVGVTSINEGVFCDCFNLTDVYYGGSNAQWNSIAIYGYNNGLDYATIHYGQTDPEPDPDPKPDPDPGPSELDLPHCIDAEWEVLRLTNRERHSYGLHPLTTQDILLEAAGIRADETTELFDHTRPDGSKFSTVFGDLKYTWASAGENIAAGQDTPEEVVDAWMNSPGHRANILDSDFAHLGVGYVEYNDMYTHYWTQLFATGWNCHYSNLVLGVEELVVEQGAELEYLPIWASVTCDYCGDCYLPILPEYCEGYDPNTPGTYAVKVSCFGLTDTMTITVTSDGKPDPEPEPETWPKTGTCGNNVTWSLTEDGTLTLSGTGATWDYPEEYPGWFEYVDLVNKCVINEGITGIGEFLFFDCWALTSVQIPDSVRYLREGAFAYCGNLTTVNIPVGVTTIDFGVFYECISLTDVYYGGSAAQWQKITIDDSNDALAYATIHYGQTDPEPDPEPEPEPHPEPTCGTTDAEIYEILISLRNEYPEGMAWDNSDSYRWNINNTIGYGCAAFTFILSDAAFGYLPSRTVYEDITIDDLRVGDILRMYNDTHSAIVLEVYEDYVVLAEGNYGSAIHWGRVYTAEEVARDTTYVITRYPEHQFENGVCTECGAKEPEPEHIPGDTNGDGAVNNKDVACLFQHLSGWDVKVAESALDVNGDGAVNNKDVACLFQYLSGWDVEIF